MDLQTQIAHDIRSPIAALHCLLTKEGCSLSFEGRRMLTMVLARIQRVAERLHTLPESPSVAQRLDLALQLKQLELNHSTSAGSPNPESARPITIKLKTQAWLQPAALISVPIEELEVLICNAINNSVEAGARQISVRLRLTANYAHILISDNGQGIETNVRHLLGKVAISNKIGIYHKGLGVLGAHSQLQKYRSSIRYKNKPSQGTLVFLRVPRIQ